MRAVVVEDQGLVREGLCLLLNGMGAFEACVALDSLAAARRALSVADSDVGLILLDLGLPDAQGYEALEALRACAPGARIMVCSGGDDADTIRGCFERGADGYLTKNASPETLRAAVEGVLRGERYVPPEILNTAPRTEARAAPRRAPVASAGLTPRQQQVLRGLAAGLANKEIAVELEMSPATVRAHVSAILRALGVENRTQAATSPEALALLAGA